MFNWKKIFKKRIDPKDIPVLEDVIDDDDEFVNKDELIEDYPHLFSNNDESSNEDDEFAIDLNSEIDSDNNSENKNAEDNSNVVLLSSVTSRADSSESNTDEVNDIDIDGTKADSIESETENSRLEDDSAVTDDDETETIETSFDLTDPAQLDVITDKIVEQLLPDLEQQLNSLVKKTLAEKSPEELIDLLNIDASPSSNKD